MVSTDILTSEQGIRILIEILFFFILYFVYQRVIGDDSGFADLLVTSGFFALWLVTVTVASNLALAFSVDTPNSVNLQHY